MCTGGAQRSFLHDCISATPRRIALGRYTKEVASTRRWLREATYMLRDLNKRPG
jgi:hypothetical protein